MVRKVFSFLAVIAFVVFFSLVFTRVGMSGSMPEAGDAVYRDIDTSITSIKLVGHAGIYIGNFEVIHMQYPKIAKGDLSNSFYVDYWGSFYAGNSKAAENRVKKAKELLKIGATYSFMGYKNFDWTYPMQPHGRCDGLIEYCYAIAGNDYNGLVKLDRKFTEKR